MKYYYFAVQIQEGNKLRASVFCFSESSNIAAIFKKYDNIAAANICPTKKRAEEVVDFWNRSFMASGIHPDCK